MTQERTRHEQHVEHATYQLVEAYGSPYDERTLAEIAAEINDQPHGWTFDLRYDTEEYVDGNSWTSVTDIEFSAATLTAIVEHAQMIVAKEILAGTDYDSPSLYTIVRNL